MALKMMLAWIEGDIMKYVFQLSHVMFWLGKMHVMKWTVHFDYIFLNVGFDIQGGQFCG